LTKGWQVRLKRYKVSGIRLVEECFFITSAPQTVSISATDGFIKIFQKSSVKGTLRYRKIKFLRTYDYWD
jgi:hypothetical protein